MDREGHKSDWGKTDFSNKEQLHIVHTGDGISNVPAKLSKKKSILESS